MSKLLRSDWRSRIRKIVADNPGIEIVIVHYADGSNDFFSAKPEVERCERWKVIEACKAIITALENTPRKRRSDAGVSRSCSSGPAGPVCPAD